MNITDDELNLLESSYTYDDYCKSCKIIKNNHGGYYPEDWWPRVQQSGMADRILARFGMNTKIQVATL